MDSDLVYVSVANAALASVPYLIALDHTTRWEPVLPLRAAVIHVPMLEAASFQQCMQPHV